MEETEEHALKAFLSSFKSKFLLRTQPFTHTSVTPGAQMLSSFFRGSAGKPEWSQMFHGLLSSVFLPAWC